MNPEIIDAKVELGKRITGTFTQAAELGASDNVGAVVVVSPTPENGDAVLMLPSGRTTTIIAFDSQAQLLLDELYAAGLYSFCWILGVQGETLTLQAHMFPQGLSFATDTPLHIAITEAAIEQLPPREQNHALEFCRREFLMGDMAFAITYNQRGTTSFHLLGPSHVCEVNAEAQGGLFATRIRRRGPQQLDRPIMLLRGAIDFIDGRFGGVALTTIHGKLRDAIQGPESYLGRWDLYNQLEEEVRKQEAIELGALPYSSWKINHVDTSIEYIFELTGAASSSRQLEGVDFEASSEGFLVEANTAVFPDQRIYVGEAIVGQKSGRSIRTKIHQNAVIQEPPPRGFLMRAWTGDAIRLSRRNQALARVRQGVVPLPTLGLLLEAGTAPLPRYDRRQPLSHAVRKRLGHEPTSSQQTALDVALNTPDIALIQGPPGTGKTTIIRALMTRLLELSEKKNRRASVLVSSYQHDAVDNAIEGVDAAGLPPLRIGGRRGAGDELRDRSLVDWIAERQIECMRVLESLGGRPAKQAARDVDILIDHWRMVRGGSESVSLLVADILSHAGPYIDPEVLHQLRETIHRFSRPTAAKALDPELVDQYQSLLKRQRRELVSFADDGPAQARRLIRFLDGVGAELQQPVPDEIRRAAEWSPDVADGMPLEQMVSAFDAAVEAIELSIQDSRAPASDMGNAVEELDRQLTSLSASIHEVARTGSNAVAEAVESFREELNDPEVVRLMIERHSGVVAGTCQQVIAPKFGPGAISYDYVIIDEAARANPLDLLIPMSLGKRVILVGDHRQLPHILEDEVRTRFAEGKEQEVVNFLEQSLFERLFTRFKAAEGQGGPKRVVTLLDEFRMHPVIGKFVSHAFYDDKVISKCKSEDRCHDLGLYGNRPAAWLDLPAVRGRETRGMSKSREAEVRVIVQEVEQILRRNSSFKIGIITFYAQQAANIQIHINEWPDEWQQRVMTGTVDAFQGREFDIVFLSAVRSNTIRDDIRKRAGFLASPNRLCVALSRARRLLVVVGDAETVAGSVQAPAIQQLNDFYQLCVSGEGYYEQR